MLRDGLVGTYRRYKADTVAFTTWLAETAKSCGYVPWEKLKGQKDSKYEVSCLDLRLQAEAISTEKERGRIIPTPIWILKAVTRSINMRKKFADWYTIRGEQDHALVKDNELHLRFVETLETIVEIIAPCLPEDKHQPETSNPKPKASTSSSKLRSNSASRTRTPTPQPRNRFESLKVQNPGSKATSSDKKKPIGSASPATFATSRPETQENSNDLIFALFCCIEDFLLLKQHVDDLWERYRKFEIDLVTASLSTNAAWELAGHLEAELMYEYPAVEDWSTAMNFILIFLENKPSTAVPQLTSRLQGHDDTNYDEVLDWAFYRTGTAVAVLLGLSDIELLKHPETSMPVASQQREEPDQVQGDENKKVLGLHDSVRRMKNRSIERCRDLLPLFAEVAVIRQCVTGPAFTVYDHLLNSIRNARIEVKRPKPSLQLVFICQMFLDIQQILGDALPRAQTELLGGALRIRKSLGYVSGQEFLTETADLHAYCEFENCAWCLMTSIASGIEIDLVAEMRTGMSPNEKEQDTKSACPSFALLRMHPTLCGILLLHHDAWLQDLSVKHANKKESIVACAHLYNAVRATKHTNVSWSDMETVIKLCGIGRMFLGSLPTEAFAKRFVVVSGLSITEFAKENQKRWSYKFKGPRRRAKRRLLQVDTPLTDALYSQTSRSIHTSSIMVSKVQEIINTPLGKGSKLSNRHDLSPQQYLERVTEVISVEQERLLFDWYAMADRCDHLISVLFDALETPLAKVRLEITSLGRVASIVYNILFASSYFCGWCRKNCEDPSILAEAAKAVEYCVENEGSVETPKMKVNHQARAPGRKSSDTKLSQQEFQAQTEEPVPFSGDVTDSASEFCPLHGEWQSDGPGIGEAGGSSWWVDAR